MSNSRLVIVAATLLLAGCAIPDPPPPDSSHPASPLAVEAPVRRRMNPLNSDNVTNQTRQLLRQGQKENEQQNQDQDPMMEMPQHN
jgi:uncharacterized lipoprotein YajG